MKRLFICLLIPALLTACSDNNEENNHDPQPDMVDMPDEPDMTDMPDEMNVCQPQTQQLDPACECQEMVESPE